MLDLWGFAVLTPPRRVAPAEQASLSEHGMADMLWKEATGC